MSQFSRPDNLHTELDEDELNTPSGLTDEERQRMEDLISRGELEPAPSLLERYVHPLTGEVLIEGGPDTPEVRADREANDRWWAEEMRKRYPPSSDSTNPK